MSDLINLLLFPSSLSFSFFLLFSFNPQGEWLSDGPSTSPHRPPQILHVIAKQHDGDFN